MHSFIIWATSQKRDSLIEAFCKKFQVASYNKYTVSFINGAGIEEVRSLSHILRLSHSGDGNRLIVLDDLDRASNAAQNALLKVLEEPPHKTILVVTCQNLHALLDTIVSRCQIVRTNFNNSASESKNGAIIKQILEAPSAQRLVLAAKNATTREKAKEFLEAISVELYTLLHQNDQSHLKQTADLLNRTQKAIQYIDANVNAKAVVDVLILGFPHIKI